MIAERIARVSAAAVLILIASRLPDLRRDAIVDMTKNDAAPGPAPSLPAAPADARGLDEAPFVRVVLIDGTNREDALAMPSWSAVCRRGVDMSVDVGFPTVSLPVQTALWTGLTQTQTGIVMHNWRPMPLTDPLGLRGIPAQVPGSIAVAENHAEIVNSLGFASAMPPLDAKVKGWKLDKSDCATDNDPAPDEWASQWIDQAKAAIAGPARLAFVHILRVDTSGHTCGRGSEAWKHAEATADQILGQLLAIGDVAHPDARWFVIADHGHIPAGGHGGERRDIRIVRGCIGGPGVADIAGTSDGGPIALADFSRALADSLGVTLSAQARGRPLAGALAAPLTGDELVPKVPAGRRWFAWILLFAAAALTGLALGRHALLWAPWWWALTIAFTAIALGAPDLSAQYIYASAPDAVPTLAMIGIYGGAAWTAGAVHLAGRAGWRVAIAQAALPLGTMCAALVLCGGLPELWGDSTVPIAPYWTAAAIEIMALTGKALWAVGLALLATSVLPAYDRAGRRGTRRTGP